MWKIWGPAHRNRHQFLSYSFSLPMDKIGADREAYLRLGQTLTKKHSDELSTQLAVYQSALVNFARDHGETIKNNPEFSRKFTQMCHLIGVDTLEVMLFLESQKKKGDNFYLGLAVRVVEICEETRDINGGLISLKELHSRLQENSSAPVTASEEDIVKSLAYLGSEGNGYELMDINRRKWIRSTGSSEKGSISTNQKKVYELCEFMGGYVTHRLLRDNFNWDAARLKTVIDEMILNGFLWIDNQGPNGEKQYWEPSWIST